MYIGHKIKRIKKKQPNQTFFEMSEKVKVDIRVRVRPLSERQVEIPQCKTPIEKQTSFLKLRIIHGEIATDHVPHMGKWFCILRGSMNTF